MELDYFDLFGLDRMNIVTKDELKKKYKSLAKQHHPDKGGDGDTFKEVQKAYKVLYRHYRKYWNTEYECRGTYDTSVWDRAKPKMAEDFSIDEFNKTFENYKIKNCYDVKLSDSFSPPPPPPTKILETNFNSEFKTYHKKNSSKNVVVYSEPKTTDDVYEAEHYVLGRDKIEDFSTRYATDFNKAYSTNSTILQNIPISKTERKEKELSKLSERQFFQTKLKSKISQRKNESLRATKSETKRRLEMQKLKKEKESQRLRNLRNQDKQITNNHSMYMYRIMNK